MMYKTRFTAALLLIALAVPAAWAGQFGDYKPHGFLSDYSNLKPEGGDSTAYKYRDPKADVAKYKKVMVDRIKIQQVAAYLETDVAKKYNWTNGVDTAAKDYLKAYSTWAYTKQAMDHWAQLIRQRLDAAQGKQRESGASSLES